MSKSVFLSLVILILSAGALPLRAQTGCEDSPEDPTFVLALISGAGALAVKAWKVRSK